MKKLSRLALYIVKNISFLKLARFFLYAFVFFLPFNINAVVYTTGTFNTGNFNPYTSFFIYFGDFLLAFALLSWAVSIFRKEYELNLTYGNRIIFFIFILFLSAAEVTVVFSQEKALSVLILIRLFECVMFYLLLVNRIIDLNKLINFFIASVSLQAVLALLQYLFQGSLGLSFLGESNISAIATGIAKIDGLNDSIIRPYGTFPHTNILAGYLVVSILLSFYKIFSKEHIVYPLLFLQLGALILTFSRTAFVALVIAWFVYISIKNTKIPYKLILVILCSFILFAVIFNLEDLFLNRLFFSDMSSLNERVFYFNISKAIFAFAPFGIGLGNFTLQMQDFTATKLAPWDFQPVHNIFLLIANEIGLAGLIIFLVLLVSFAVLIFKKMKKSHSENRKFGIILLCSISAYLVVGLFDHYLFTLYQGLMLSFFLFGIYGRYVSEENH